MGRLTFAKLTRVNYARCKRWHPRGLDEWSPSDWAVAMVGEAGEACNAIKKLRRVEEGLANKNDDGRQLDTRAKAIAAIADELADMLIYLNLLALRLNIDLEAATVRKFNAVSERYGFPERL